MAPELSWVSEYWIYVLNLTPLLLYLFGSGSVLGIQIQSTKLLNTDPIRIHNSASKKEFKNIDIKVLDILKVIRDKIKIIFV